MSTLPAFKTFVFVSPETFVIAGQSGKEGFTSEYSGAAFPAKSEVADSIQGKNILLIVSDEWAGHLQMVQPNKKANLTEEAIGERLTAEFGIEPISYEFALQQFPVSREQVQVSVSGIEREAYTRLLEWLKPLGAKKVWFMPLAWFMAPLKSVEPVLLALALDTDHIAVSHHYLGVDDGRVIRLAELAAYVESRKQERKETHLLSAHAAPSLLQRMEQTVGERAAVHPLLGQPAGKSPIIDIMNAVWEKSSDALPELLHFVVEMPEIEEEPAPAPKPAKASAKAVAAEKEVLPPVSDEPIADLPKPSPPPFLQEEPVVDVVTEEAVVVEVEVVSEPEQETTAEEVVEEPQAESAQEPEPAAAPVAPKATAPEESTSQVHHDALAASQLAILAQMQHARVTGIDNSERYREVPQKRSWKGIFLIFFLVTGLTAVVAGGIFMSQQSPATRALLPSTSPTPTPTPAPEATPVPSPTPNPASMTAEEKAKLKVIVLNATGRAGLAGQKQKLLLDAGWKNVKTGNATGSYQDADFIVSSAPGIQSVVETDMKMTFRAIDSVKEAAASGYDVVIIIAK